MKIQDAPDNSQERRQAHPAEERSIPGQVRETSCGHFPDMLARLEDLCLELLEVDLQTVDVCAPPDLRLGEMDGVLSGVDTRRRVACY